jgi:hypothetical protein
VQQRGCARNSEGCKELLTIDAVISGQAFKKNRNICTTYIDYKKAFDSVPHDWLIRVLEIYKIDPITISFLKHAMSTWKTKIELMTSQGRTLPLPVLYRGHTYNR